jgi:hypothetical protein
MHATNKDLGHVTKGRGEGKTRRGVRRAEEREREREGYLYEERDEGLDICSSTRALPIT